MDKGNQYSKIVQLIKDKASIKQQIYRNAYQSFQLFQQEAQKLIKNLDDEVEQFDKDVSISYEEKGPFQFQIKIGGDIVLFQMHTNVFDFDAQHSIFKTSYLKEDRNRSYCGIINIYNFLADSMKYNRFEDTAYLIGRVFINKDNHFFVEGKQKLNFIHNNFINEVMNPMVVQDVIQHSIIYSMDFDLFTPPYKHVQAIHVGQLMRESSSMHLKTEKSMGYKFSFED